ncbi:MAG: YgjP-like metallopeptidase domain-containing protein [Acetobacteraceae bacterium]
MADLLRAEARRRLAAIVAAKCAMAGLTARRVIVKDTRSRWGSCSPDRTLMFCWRLVMAPPLVQDYVVAHEVAHLQHMNHGARFWALVTELTPHTDAAVGWLKREGAGAAAHRGLRLLPGGVRNGCAIIACMDAIGRCSVRLSAREAPMFKLFYAPGSCALASHIALEEAGADYETVRLDLRANDQNAPEYLAINPKGRVPTLVTEHGTLTETPAILAFIAQVFSGRGPCPAGRFLRLRAGPVLQQLSLFDGPCRPRPSWRGHRWADDPAAITAMQRKVPEAVGASFSLIERCMFQGPWVMGVRLYDL